MALLRPAAMLSLLLLSTIWVDMAMGQNPGSDVSIDRINGTDAGFGSSSSAAESVPFPGPGWLERMAADPDNAYTTADGRQFSSVYSAILDDDPLGEPCRNFNAYINSFLFGNAFVSRVVDAAGIEWGHYIVCYLRNFVGALIVYYLTAAVFHYFCYVHPQSKDIFRDRERPSRDVMWEQIKFAQASMFLYTLVPVFDEWLIEKGYTRAYFTVAEIGGWPAHIACMLLYFACVEVGIYWVHRTLHTNKFLYKYIHMPHHVYNRPETLTPWASIAFHPLDGMAQCSPYIWVMPFVPCHYLCHVGLVFFTAIWATYIHDAMDWNIDPIMGSKYHTVHHTHYIYNYGQVFTFCDRFWGTFKRPDGPTGTTGKRKSAKTE